MRKTIWNCLLLVLGLTIVSADTASILAHRNRRVAPYKLLKKFRAPPESLDFAKRQVTNDPIGLMYVPFAQTTTADPKAPTYAPFARSTSSSGTTTSDPLTATPKSLHFPQFGSKWATWTPPPTTDDPPLTPPSIRSGQLPGGRPFSSLSEKFEIFDGQDEWTRIVANNETVYVLHPVQRKDRTKTNYVYDPWTIGQVLGYIYEVNEFGAKGPPGGFTITLMGKPKPIRRRIHQRNTRKLGRGLREALLVFSRKGTHVD